MTKPWHAGPVNVDIAPQDRSVRRIASDWIELRGSGSRDAGTWTVEERTRLELDVNPDRHPSTCCCVYVTERLNNGHVWRTTVEGCLTPTHEERRVHGHVIMPCCSDHLPVWLSAVGPVEAFTTPVLSVDFARKESPKRLPLGLRPRSIAVRHSEECFDFVLLYEFRDAFRRVVDVDLSIRAWASACGVSFREACEVAADGLIMLGLGDLRCEDEPNVRIVSVLGRDQSLGGEFV